MTRPLSELDARVCQCHPNDLRPADGDSPEAEAAAIRAAQRGFTHPADTD